MVQEVKLVHMDYITKNIEFSPTNFNVCVSGGADY